MLRFRLLAVIILIQRKVKQKIDKTSNRIDIFKVVREEVRKIPSSLICDWYFREDRHKNPCGT